MAPVLFEDQCEVSVCYSGMVPARPRLFFHPFSSRALFLSPKRFLSSRNRLTLAVSLFLLSEVSFLFPCLTPAPTRPSRLQPAHPSDRPTPSCVVLAQTSLYSVSSLGTTLFSVLPVPSTVTASAK